jgi:hypothetical protein
MRQVSSRAGSIILPERGDRRAKHRVPSQAPPSGRVALIQFGRAEPCVNRKDTLRQKAFDLFGERLARSPHGNFVLSFGTIYVKLAIENT